MTPKQKAWLDAHPEYEVIRPGGLAQAPLGGATAPDASMTGGGYSKIGSVKPDGTFVENAAPDNARELGVGIFEPPKRLTPEGLAPIKT